MSRPLAVLSFSGGMDSTTLAAHYHDSGYEMMLLSFDYGQRHSRELLAARRVAQHFDAEHQVVDLTAVGALMPGSALTDPAIEVPDGHYEAESMRVTVVPNRNAIMANIAVGIAAARRAQLVGLGIHAGDHAIYPDCRPAFLDALRACVTRALEGHHTPRIEAPFITWTKAQIAEHAHLLGAPLGLSWSCYKGQKQHCGTCGTCTERREAFADAGVPDPTDYAV
ncbi:MULTISPECIES: 7-cyano-7-deazaguanine synthase QueC [Streptomycetaceae]|uniref:7-cyano-7-deazaguanine synthase n=1 Tax=Streptantibioticus cattleyicolor (strain ATCC 35852 / DSM 46488 / JCM 4925 / NBRC 14057 / NRRL 8057) TaxID=1003195 RepID=F8JT15_STREN|nr:MULTISPECIES: 7-cyano-7-deazaguanine synthase QueC [Streptomycetaceae]AEW92950.1 ToyM [Streptantibioticus cattleyicolor NRRL 8057 = DSM 46488]MYS57697.1 7-cyano-7-deazaguanine synthase QueC [Streptomyces sp. SID5468]CCB73311.1 Queuosine biosynthesis protein queC [Streptantibioticus cattleyicolor NRRL 8057 = DSM 46488]